MFVNSVGLFINKPNIRQNSVKKTDSVNFTGTNSLQRDMVSFGAKPPMEELQKYFDNYKPVILDFRDYKIPVHNNKIADRMKDEYSPDSFDALFEFADKKGVFDVNVDEKTNYVQTSLINPKENPLMSKLVWVTDSCNIMPLLKDKHPEICVPLMENMSAYYAKQQRSFDRIINNPDLFELNHDWPNTAKNGVGHVFNPKNGISHKWFAKTRLDSMGLYIGAVTDLMKDGFNGADYGYKKADDVSSNTIEAMANAARYLQKINYAYAKDTGPWEEKTFNATTTSDVAIINESFRKLLDFMYAPTDNKEILKIRKRLLNAKNGEVFKDEAALRQQLEIGEYRIKTNSKHEVPNERKLDGAMGFIFKTEKLDDDVVKNAKKVMKRLTDYEKGVKGDKEIVRENGVIRYNKDKYLYLNSDLSGKKSEYNPQRKFPPKTEAQWFMVSDISASYGKVAKSLMDKIEQDGESSKEIDKLLKYALKKETEYINRGYARITGKHSYKANGVKAPAYQVPEAYQAIKDSKGNIKFVPGTHTPLAWAQASLYDASKVFLDNLERYEELQNMRE